MTMITPSYLGETIEYSSLHACRSTLEDPTQQSLTPAEYVELAGLTSIMRHHVESELNLPMKGVRDLHRKLLKLGATGQRD